MSINDTPTVRPGGYRTSARALNHLIGWVAGQDTRGRLPLTVDAVCADAAARTGLSDWGGDDHLEPMHLLFDDLAAAPPTPLGRLLMRESFVLALMNRLRLRAHVRATRPPPARRPFIIVGANRSGTTLLQHLLGALPGRSFVPLYKLMEPAPRFGRLARAVLATQGAWHLAPEMPTLHPQAARGPEECWMLLMSSFRVVDYALHWPIPRYAAWLETCDMRPAYAAYADALAALAPQVPGQLVMKGPGHLHALDALAHQVPEARLIWTHRDPLACAASFASLSAVHHRSMYGVHDPVRAGANSVERLARALHRGVAARAHVPDDRILDVHYPDLTADPVGAVARICARFDEPFDDDARAAVEAELARVLRSRPPPHVYTPEQWGLDPDEVRERFTGYDQAFGRDRGRELRA